MGIASLFVRKKAENPSLPAGKLVRGHTIPRLPVGSYMEAVQALKNLPVDLISACFPGKTLSEALGELKSLDEQALMRLVVNIAGSGVPYVLGIIAQFSGIAEKDLLEDPDIGLDGLVEIVQAIWEVNGWGNVVAAVHSALPQKPAKTIHTGSKA